MAAVAIKKCNPLLRDLVMNRTTVKQPSEKLKQKIDDVAKHFQNCSALVNEAFVWRLEEGFSEKEIGQMIRKQLVQLGYDHRTIRGALPSSAKDISKTRKDYLTRNQGNNSDERPDEDKMSSLEHRI